jgi:nuclear transcription Y subunit beta
MVLSLDSSSPVSSRRRFNVTAGPATLGALRLSADTNAKRDTNFENSLLPFCADSSGITNLKWRNRGSAFIMTTTNPLLAPMDSTVTEPELASPPTITEQEIGEFREQDRVLPVGV